MKCWVTGTQSRMEELWQAEEIRAEAFQGYDESKSVLQAASMQADRAKKKEECHDV